MSFGVWISRIGRAWRMSFACLVAPISHFFGVAAWALEPAALQHCAADTSNKILTARMNHADLV
jgi:hypothetical protein